MNKIKKVLSTVIAIALVITSLAVTNVTTVQAAVKLNKTTASIYVGDTVQLKLAGAKTVTWSSSNKKIATVTNKGLVKGIKKGSCQVIAKDKKTKKSYKCKITVKALKSFGLKADDVWVFSGGNTIAYYGYEIKGATYVLDGKTLKSEDYEIWNNGDGDVYTGITLTEQLSEGNHTISIKKKGYKTFTAKFTFEKVKVSGMFAEDPWVEDGTLYLLCNPELDGKTFTITVDGTAVTPSYDMGINGDGNYIIWVDASGLSKGQHTVEVKAEGIPDGTAEFTIE